MEQHILTAYRSHLLRCLPRNPNRRRTHRLVTELRAGAGENQEDREDGELGGERWADYVGIETFVMGPGACLVTKSIERELG